MSERPGSALGHLAAALVALGSALIWLFVLIVVGFIVWALH